jgi:hypothetical protein
MQTDPTDEEPFVDRSEADGRPFRRGDVVRDRTGRHFGVVVHVERFDGPADPVELLVDEPGQGVGTWPAAMAVLSNDPDSIAEARRLRLRGLS